MKSPKTNLYSAAMTAGKAAGEYSSALSDISEKGEEMSFIGREASYDLAKSGQFFGAISTAVELGSTLHGGWLDKKDFEMKSGMLEDTHGKMSEVKRGFWDTVFGAPRQYQFGEGDDAKIFSKAGVLAEGGLMLGEGYSPNMYEEATGVGGNTNQNTDKSFISTSTQDDEDEWVAPEDVS
tara:strand:+ start:2286 stop:2825 length:540 start_codon:yes stop_codon:yes gene_type:complete